MLVAQIPSWSLKQAMEDVMWRGEWVHGPFGLDAERGRTFPSMRTVLVVAHHLTAATRLADIVPLLETDWRVQVAFTYAPSSIFSASAQEFLMGLGGVVLPWHQATQVRFDLAIAAAYGLLEQLHAPVMTVPHGVSFNKYPCRWDGLGPQAPREVAGLEQAGLVYRGRVVPSAIVVPTRRDLARLRNACPAAAPAGIVGGDPCYDRLAASLPLRDSYRRALGVEGRKLIAVTSTWGPGSLLHQCPDLLSRLVGELPRQEYCVAVFMHPHVWYWHGRRQLHAWYAECMRRGLVLVPPEQGWRAILTAADWVIGDHGSATCYGASAGVPVLLAAFAADEVDPGSPASHLGQNAFRLRPDQPVAGQLHAASAAWPPGWSASVRSQITDVPGQSARIIRETMYRLMKLPEPDRTPTVHPVLLPRPAVIPEASGASL